MKANGNSLPAKTGPAPVDELRDGRHLERRQHEQDRDAEEAAMVPIFMNADR